MKCRMKFSLSLLLCGVCMGAFARKEQWGPSLCGGNKGANTSINGGVATRVITSRAARYEDELKEKFENYFKALKDEKMSEALAIYGPLSESELTARKAEYKKLFADHDLQYTMENFRVASATSQRARVDFYLTTESIGGSGNYRNNRARVTCELTRRKKVWRLVSRKVDKIKYADGKK